MVLVHDWVNGAVPECNPTDLIHAAIALDDEEVSAPEQQAWEFAVVNGEEVSTREVKAILADIIAGEDKQHPLADDKLMEMLSEKGYSIARRTVAKYREGLGIPVARLRKQL